MFNDLINDCISNLHLLKQPYNGWVVDKLGINKVVFKKQTSDFDGLLKAYSNQFNFELDGSSHYFFDDSIFLSIDVGSDYAHLMIPSSFFDFEKYLL